MDWRTDTFHLYLCLVDGFVQSDLQKRGNYESYERENRTQAKKHRD